MSNEFIVSPTYESNIDEKDLEGLTDKQKEVWKKLNECRPIERLQIDSLGNVGIGTTAPGHALHVTTSHGTLYIDNDEE